VKILSLQACGMSLKVVGGLGKTFKLAMFLIALFFSLPALGLIFFCFFSKKMDDAQTHFN
jgi:hypothetical protein